MIWEDGEPVIRRKEVNAHHSDFDGKRNICTHPLFRAYLLF